MSSEPHCIFLTVLCVFIAFLISFSNHNPILHSFLTSCDSKHSHSSRSPLSWFLRPSSVSPSPSKFTSSCCSPTKPVECSPSRLFLFLSSTSDLYARDFDDSTLVARDFEQTDLSARDLEARMKKQLAMGELTLPALLDTICSTMYVFMFWVH